MGNNSDVDCDDSDRALDDLTRAVAGLRSFVSGNVSQDHLGHLSQTHFHCYHNVFRFLRTGKPAM